MGASRSAAVLATALVFGLGCASSGGPRDPGDPWEPFNRKVFAFNEGFDRALVEPAAKGWDFVLPEGVQASVKNVFDNLFLPAVFVNHLLQGRFEAAFTADLPRFVMNTTVGWAGLFDAASTVDIEKHYTDFGTTLGRWGIPPGPYLVLPILGSSSPRNAVGKAADAWSVPYIHWVAPWVSVAVRAVELVNLRSLYAEELLQSHEDALDYYRFVRSAFEQNRAHRVREARGEEAAPEVDDSQVDLYYFDPEIDEEAIDESEPGAAAPVRGDDADEDVDDAAPRS